MHMLAAYWQAWKQKKQVSPVKTKANNVTYMCFSYGGPLWTRTEAFQYECIQKWPWKNIISRLKKLAALQLIQSICCLSQQLWHRAPCCRLQDHLLFFFVFIVRCCGCTSVRLLLAPPPAQVQNVRPHLAQSHQLSLAGPWGWLPGWFVRLGFLLFLP